MSKRHDSFDRFAALLQEAYLCEMVENKNVAGPSEKFFRLGSIDLRELIHNQGEKIWTATQSWKSFETRIHDGVYEDREIVLLDAVDAFFDNCPRSQTLHAEFERIADHAGMSVESVVAVAVLGSMRERLLRSNQ